MEVLQPSPDGDIGQVPRCEACGSERVVRDAWAAWNTEFGRWEIETMFDQARCQACDAETTLIWCQPERPATQRIRELNDRFRCQGIGNGSVMVTSGIQALGAEQTLAILEAVRRFDAFDDGNDPWGERDFGAIDDLAEERIFWKLDYYNPGLTAGSENPANEGLTHRVLTVMLASEY